MVSRNRAAVVSGGLLGLAMLCRAPAALALPGGAEGGIVGWVEDAKGAPVAGALVSLFGKGLRGGSFVTQSDSAGRFLLPDLPAGSYTLRALGVDRAATRQIQVLPNRDSVFTLSFAAAQRTVDAQAALETDSQSERELRWLLRHKRRSVLEARDADGPQLEPTEARARGDQNLLESLVPWIPELGGAVQLAASPALFGGAGSESSGLDLGSPSLGSLQLQGRLADRGRFSVTGPQADSESTTWRTAAEFLVEPGAGHQLQAGAGYGTRYLQPTFAVMGEGQLDNRATGAVFAHDRWQVGERLSVSGGARYSYVGFLRDRDSWSPTAAVEYRLGRATSVRASASSRSLAPGGDILTMSTLSTTPAMAIALVGEDVRAERVSRQELGLDRRVGSASMGTFLFRESVRDRLVNHLDKDARTLRILNGSGVLVQGAGISLGHRFGDVVNGSVTYAYGRSRLDPGFEASPGSAASGGFHDVVTRVETFVDWSGTRVVAYCRFNSWTADGESRSGPVWNSRFDVRVTQGLPFLSSMTRTEWEILVAFRNMFYEASEAGILDEIAVVNPPKRVLGGISVRF